MEYKKLKRDGNYFIDNFIIKDNKTLIKEPIKVMFPTRYLSKDLCVISSVVSVISMYCIFNDDKYCFVSAPIVQDLNPYLVDDIEYQNVKYKVLYFNNKNAYSNNNTLIKSDKYIYALFNEFYMSGKIPWYNNYEDISNLFQKASKYADSSVGNDPLIMEILTYLISRNKNNKDEYFRYSINNKNDIFNKEIAYVGLNNIFYSLTNTTSKLIGGYFNDALNNALVKEEISNSKVSDLLRE